MTEPTFLRNLHITRVDRVAAGANQFAQIALFKSADADAQLPAQSAGDQGDIMPDAIDKDTLDPAVAQLIASLETQLAEAKAVADTPAPTVEEFLDTVEETALAEAVDKKFGKSLVAKADETPAPEPIPEAVQKKLDEAEAINKAYADRIVALEKSARTAEFITKAADFSALGGAAELAPVLMNAADSMDPAQYQALEAYLKSANALATEAHQQVTKERGISGTPAALSVAAEIDGMVAKAREAAPTLSEAQARTQVLEAHPDLYSRYMESKTSNK